MSRQRFLSVVAILCTSCAVVIGCGNDGGGSRIVNPPRETLAKYWPNADSSWWTFDYQQHFALDAFDPALDGLDLSDPEGLDYRDLEVRLSLELPSPDLGAYSQVGLLRVEFDGTIGSDEGAKQNLDAEVFLPAKRRPSQVSPLLARIYLARPDLRDKMIAEGFIPPEFTKEDASARAGILILRGGQFEKQDRWMGFYGDLSADSTFTIARAPLREGATFRHQLVPQFADDVWEYGWVIGERAIETPAGEFVNAMGIVYVLDLGVATDVQDPGRMSRVYIFIKLFLAPDVGPIYEREFSYLSPASPGTESSLIFAEATLTGYALR